MSGYDTDIFAWSEHQSDLLRRRAAGEPVNEAELDWPHIAEEIESLSTSERSKLRSLIATVIERLIKLQASPAVDPRNGWKETIFRNEDEIDLMIKDSPTLRRFVSDMVADGTRRSRRFAAQSLALCREQPTADIDSLIFTEDQVVEGW
jgi:hypothetical protein